MTAAIAPNGTHRKDSLRCNPPADPAQYPLHLATESDSYRSGGQQTTVGSNNNASIVVKLFELESDRVANANS